MNYYDKKELELLTDPELLTYLRDSWGYDRDKPIKVFGELSATSIADGKFHYRLREVTSLEGDKLLEYPILNFDDRNQISYNGIFIPPIGSNSKILKLVHSGSAISVICELELSNKAERIKHENPLLLNVKVGTIQLSTKIENDYIERDDGSIIIKASVFKYIKDQIKDDIKIKEEEAKKELQAKIQLIKSDEERLANELQKIEQNFESKQTEINKNIEELEKKIISKEKILKKFEDNSAILQTQIKEKKVEKDSLIDLIEELKNELAQMEETMAKKIEKFHQFIKDKADQLLKLEFIDQEEYDDLMMAKKSQTLDEKFISFSEDLGADYQKAISHIHAYLFNQDIVYPRYVIEDFMALIQTNDLIILAGESGSGKTNLIKSFAKAIGGKSFIIPVKPNWTSSEDLLGYYNPLEKKYLATPFLEAILEAKNNPETPYFICLDEMNLARVEYYFADFLSLLEERDKDVEINLYSDSESSHVLSEFKNVLEIINSSKEKFQKNNIVDFVSLLRDDEINGELKKVFGFSDKDSLIKYHTDLRKMISGLINIPSSIMFPKNVRIIGAINIDETTNYLSPKILDRAHIMKFDSPLLYEWVAVANEIEQNDKKDHILKFNLIELGVRQPYPSFDRDDEFCNKIVNFTKTYFSPMGIEVGLRTIRQGLNYKKIFIGQGSDERFVMNNFILHKILPKMTFDGGKKTIVESVEREKTQLLSDFMSDLKSYIHIDEKSIQYKSNNAIIELEHIIKNASGNNGIVNYWA